jgi:hypothetical protein
MATGGIDASVTLKKLNRPFVALGGRTGRKRTEITALPRASILLS